MPTWFKESLFYTLDIKCPHCGWQGKGDETHIVDFFGVVRVKEVHCPNCDKKLGNIEEEEIQGDDGDELSNQIG